jgi:hypothetical protein
MLTEDEAKTKWCPFVRVTGCGSNAGSAEWHTNRPSFAEVHDKGFDRCIGSACMAWRRAIRPAGPGGQMEKDLGGFCGLAGKP